MEGVRLDLDVDTCLAQVRCHDQDAARVLVEHLYPFVIRIIRRHRPRRIEEEDLAQEIFIKMFAKLDQYAGEVPLEHWVSRIAVNHCLNALRAESIRPEWRLADLSEEQASALEAITQAATPDPTPAQRMASQELVDQLLQSLEPEDRLLIQMLELEECTIEEVRQVTGWSSPYIRVRAFRARQKLNRRFSQLRTQARL